MCFHVVLLQVKNLAVFLSVGKDVRVFVALEPFLLPIKLNWHFLLQQFFEGFVLVGLLAQVVLQVHEIRFLAMVVGDLALLWLLVVHLYFKTLVLE